MKKIDKIWSELEEEQSLKSGILYKRYSGAIKPDVYVAVKSPEKLRCIAARLNSKAELQLKTWDELRDIRIETVHDDKHLDKQFLLVLLLDNQHRDIFSTLSEDLIHQVSDIGNELELIRILLLRLEKWRLLFEKIGKKGLSEVSQQGLFGELYFLRRFLEANTSVRYSYCVNSWKGPENTVQDFQYADWAVEVKTTHGNNHQKIHITSERQLDDSIIEKILLYHLSLDIRVGNGETLNSIINEILDILKEDPMVSNMFKIKLLESGYYETHRLLYEERGYTIRQENLYRVSRNFPRITENQIPIGVGDVRYSIVLSELEEWRIDQKNFFNEIQ